MTGCTAPDAASRAGTSGESRRVVELVLVEQPIERAPADAEMTRGQGLFRPVAASTSVTLSLTGETAAVAGTSSWPLAPSEPRPPPSARAMSRSRQQVPLAQQDRAFERVAELADVTVPLGISQPPFSISGDAQIGLENSFAYSRRKAAVR